MPETLWGTLLFFVIGPTTSEKLFALFLIVVLLVAAIRLVRLWVSAPPFWLRRQEENPNYLRILERWRLSIKQWISLTALCWALVFSYEVANFSIYAAESKSTGAASLLLAIWRLGTLMELTAFALLFLFLVQWHMLNRAQQLHAWAAKKARKTVPSQLSK